MAKVLIVTPADPRSRKGNRITAQRWAHVLRKLGQRVEITQRFVDQRCDVLLALHAFKSARCIARFAAQRPQDELLVALTGTDLYHDIGVHAAARRSLELATQLIMLQPCGMAEVPRHLRGKAKVILQSAVPPSRRLPPLRTVFEICVAGHLRSVKDPFRAAMAARQLPPQSRIQITHIGAALTESMGRRAEAERARNPRYRWLGDVPLPRARQLIARSRALVLSSKMEGGANVVSEALVAGVPVLASWISGSIGMLGGDYRGYFEVGQTRELAALMRRCEDDAEFYFELRQQSAERAELFHPAHELAAWRELLESLGIECG